MSAQLNCTGSFRAFYLTVSLTALFSPVPIRRMGRDTAGVAMALIIKRDVITSDQTAQLLPSGPPETARLTAMT
jgi:hypothetical protein